MVSASRAGSSMVATDISISGGMRLLSLTYASKVACTERTSASTSTLRSFCSSTSSASTRKNLSFAA